MSPGIEWMLRCLGDHCTSIGTGSSSNHHQQQQADTNSDNAGNNSLKDAVVATASSLTGKEIFQVNNELNPKLILTQSYAYILTNSNLSLSNHAIAPFNIPGMDLFLLLLGDTYELSRALQ